MRIELGRLSKTLLLALAATCGLSSLESPLLSKADAALPRKLGLGAVFGEPTGFTAKYWLDSRDAADAGLAYSFDGFLLLYADYLVHFPSLVNQTFAPATARTLHPYLGVGGLFFISTRSDSKSRSLADGDDKVGFGVRIPLGIEWTPSSTQFGVFLEIVPGLGLLPSTTGFLQGGLGVRYYLDPQTY